MKPKLNTYYDNMFGAGEETDWSFCADTDMWYEDAAEVLPKPKCSSEKVKDFSAELLIGRELFLDDTRAFKIEADWLAKESPLADFAKYLLGLDDFYNSISSVILLKTPGNKWLLDFGQEVYFEFNQYSMWDLAEFIQKLKNSPFATQYIEEVWSIKLIAWTDNRNRTRFVVHSYDDGFYYGETLFDITIDREILIQKLSALLEEWKTSVYQAILEKEKALGKKVLNPSCDKAIEYFFPNLFTGKR